MSLAVLPSSPINCSGAPAPTILPPAAGPSKRPKLSLNTSSLPTTFGKSSTSLRLETLSVISPTSRNTFSNAYGNAPSVKRPSSGSERPKLSLNSTVAQTHMPQISTPLRTSQQAPELSSTSTTSAISVSSGSTLSTLDSSPPPVPYRIPYNTRSILANGPLPRPRRRASFTTTRPMFPAPKRVAFKAPLTEDIKTEKYTLAHSDLASSSSSISTLNLPPPEHDTDRSSSNPGGVRITQHKEGEALSKKGKEPHTGDKRDSSDEDSDVCPATPVAGRRKRRREWVWTLGPVGGKDAASSDDQPVQPAVVAEAAKQT